MVSMNDDVKRSLQVFRNAWQLLLQDYPTYTRSTSGENEYVFSGLPIAFLNVAIPTQENLSEQTLRSSAEAACAWAADKSIPWFYILTHEQLGDGVDATSVLDGCGLAPAVPLTGMFAPQVAPITQIPDTLKIGVAEDDAGCTAILDINAAAYEMDLDSSKGVIGKRAYWQNHIAVVGRVDEVPVSSTCILLVDGYHYVALVATHPDHQQRGYANAIMRRTLELAGQVYGPGATLLHATEAGRPVYEKMGYQPISTHTLFMEKHFLSEH